MVYRLGARAYFERSEVCWIRLVPVARIFLLLAAVFGLTGVALGALAAHGLQSVLSTAELAVLHTAVHYQQLHALALLGVALLLLVRPGPLLYWAGWLVVVGILAFSGSLYFMTLTPWGKLGLVTPFGGMALMAGWLCLGIHAWRVR